VTPVQVALERHVPTVPAEVVDLIRLRQLAAVEPDPWVRTIHLHLTASALVVDPASARVLLRWHAKQQLWLQVGGHADPGESDPWAIARREAVEETGLPDLRHWPAPEPALAQVAIVTVNAVGGEDAHEHGDLRYLLATSRPEDLPAEVEGVPLRWVSVDEARAVADEGLGRLLDLAARLLG
jgi:8-oxo-dGTP pyrophosphatase MutT (NUDIX family)